ncbi:hypothetical protein B0H10DRAFT_2217663 [Mycena sp. CBHHK59/15]|nr:hypothetical protein B0H10DRAFT_2217663 [Mycena sp. CBHHK59/15]
MRVEAPALLFGPVVLSRSAGGSGRWWRRRTHLLRVDVEVARSEGRRRGRVHGGIRLRRRPRQDEYEYAYGADIGDAPAGGSPKHDAHPSPFFPSALATHPLHSTPTRRIGQCHMDHNTVARPFCPSPTCSAWHTRSSPFVASAHVAHPSHQRRPQSPILTRRIHVPTDLIVFLGSDSHAHPTRTLSLAHPSTTPISDVTGRARSASALALVSGLGKWKL